MSLSLGELTHWPLGKFEWNFKYVVFKCILVIDGWDISCKITLIWMSLDFTDKSVNIGSGNGLVPSGTKPLPEPILTQICRHMVSLGRNELTHWGRDKWPPFSNAFSWMKMYQIRFRFHWSLFLRFELTISQHWFISWLGAGQATSHYLNQWWLVHRRIYASPGLNELKDIVDSCDLLKCIFQGPRFSKMSSDWLMAVLPANQMLG